MGTDEKLLKWKYGSMNSVDFLLRSKAAGEAWIPHVSHAPSHMHCTCVYHHLQRPDC